VYQPRESRETRVVAAGFYPKYPEFMWRRGPRINQEIRGKGS
jgi:hypothetical protein